MFGLSVSVVRWIGAAIVVAIVAGVYFYGRAVGAASVQSKWDRANLEAAEDAREQTALLAKQGAALALNHKREIDAVRTRYERAIDGLRNRPDRVPDASAPACRGATGAELSRPDAEFLTRLAADAERVAAEAVACLAREKALTEAMLQGRK